MLLETALSQYGAEVTTAANASDALEEIERRPPNVVLSDLAMPNEDGLSLIRKLRARPDSMGGDIPAIAITAYASANDCQATAAAGFQAHVAKPFEVAEVATLMAMLSHASSSRS